MLYNQDQTSLSHPDRFLAYQEIKIQWGRRNSAPFLLKEIHMFNDIQAQIQHIKNSDPASRSSLEILLLYFRSTEAGISEIQDCSCFHDIGYV